MGTKVIIYRDRNGKAPLIDWFETLTPKARTKCRVRLERLAEMGHELRRPEADYLRGHIHELRARQDGINYRMLYFFHGREAVVVSHGIMKQRDNVPNAEIEIAIQRMRAFTKDPKAHTYEE